MQPCPRSPIGEARLLGESEDVPFTDWMSGSNSHWREDSHCSYCGSLFNDYFMQRLETRDVEVGPTDKSYKVYVRNAGGKPFRRLDVFDGEKILRETHETKFYFQHLTNSQMRRFVELMNAGQIAMGHPGYFYMLPFFTRRG